MTHQLEKLQSLPNKKQSHGTEVKIKTDKNTLRFININLVWHLIK